MFCWYISTPKDFPFFSDATAISTSSRRIGCRSSSWGWLQPNTALSPQLSYLYSSEQYSVHLLRISFSSVRHFPDLSWIVEDLPCFSEVRSFTKLICSLAVVFVQASFNLLALSSYPVLPCFLHCLLNPPVCFPVLFCSFCFIPLSKFTS